MVSTRLGEKAAVGEADEYGEKNAKAIGQSIAPFYGQAAGEKFATLIVGHYSAVKSYMNAAFANGFKGNATLKKAAIDKLTKNASQRYLNFDLVRKFVRVAGNADTARRGGGACRPFKRQPSRSRSRQEHGLRPALAALDRCGRGKTTAS